MIWPEDQFHLIEQMRHCTSCDLSRSRTQVVPGDYGPRNGICFIGEAPGRDEDLQGRPFVGRSGKLLDQMLQEIGWSRQDVSVLNIVKCRPPENRTPLPEEMTICGNKWLRFQIEYLKPKIIIGLGSVALKFFFPNERITKVKGKLLFMNDGTPFLPFFHPAYVLRNGSNAMESYRADFQQLREIMEGLTHLEQKHVSFKDKQSSLDDFF